MLELASNRDGWTPSESCHRSTNSKTCTTSSAAARMAGATGSTLAETRSKDGDGKVTDESTERLDYGHTLLSALPKRRHKNPAVHLPNTLRRQNRDSPRKEKMVDTALAADLLQSARSDPEEWALVVAEDDDFVPPVFTAESWVSRHGGRVLIVRTRPANAYLKMDGLLEPIR